MQKLLNLANKVKKLTVDDFMLELAEHKTFTDLIIELNTRKQLYEQGIDSRGRLLEDIGGPYSPYTIELKKEKGQRYDHVTLNDTGAFYESFRVYIDGQGDLVITADTIKDTTDLLVEWGKDILGLTDDSLATLRDEAKKILIPYLKNHLLSA